MLIRRLSFCSALKRPTTSHTYKSRSIWDDRFKCGLLSGGEDIIKTINSKIASDIKLNNLELDIFINVTEPRSEDSVHLKETAKLLKEFRSSIAANTHLPSTPHATCRLFLYSNQLQSLIALLEDRIRYGVFPDFYATNLLLDAAIEKDDYLSGARIAALVMLQEEFGINYITDWLCLYSVSKYIESMPNFEEWSSLRREHGLTFSESDASAENETDSTEQSSVGTSTEEQDGDDDEDAEYIRVPFLKNPYSDNHFDIEHPRLICGKIFEALARVVTSTNEEVGLKASLLGDILQTKWYDAASIVKLCEEKDIKLGSIKEIAISYIDNLHGLNESEESSKQSLLSSLGGTDGQGESLSSLAEQKCHFKDQEERDLNQFRIDLSLWSELRFKILQESREKEERKLILEEIRLKKESLRQKEQYLYFYDNLKKSTLTRIEYD